MKKGSTYRGPGRYLGVDVGSVSTNVVVMNARREIVRDVYLPTAGDPLAAVSRGLGVIAGETDGNMVVDGVGTTGSGRRIAAAFLGADVVNNEITAHSVAALHLVPDARTVVEIGGQDSKLMLLRDGVVVDFAMNTVCAAGTGSFLDRQAERLGVGIEELGRLARQAERAVRIAGRCAVFAETDMIHKQQAGRTTPSIVRGLCEALVRNYLNNVCKGKTVQSPVVFQGGVASNSGMRAALERALGCEVHVPEHHRVMGALGAALLAQEEGERRQGPSSFRGFGLTRGECSVDSFTCTGCSSRCEITEIRLGEGHTARWGGRCDRPQHAEARDAANTS